MKIIIATFTIFARSVFICYKSYFIFQKLGL